MASYVGKPTNLLRSGPLVAVKLWVLQQVKTAIPPIDAFAEINTANPRTSIQEGVATSLGLEPKDTAEITTMTTQAYTSYVYRIRLAFPNEKAIEVDAIEVPYMLRSGMRIKCITGRDILQLGVLTYDGPGNTFSFDF